MPTPKSHPSRRTFLLLTTSAAATAAIAGTLRGAQQQPATTTDQPKPPTPKPSPAPAHKPANPAAKKLNLLILGGTAFLGPEVVEAAQSRGHSITLFNRGKTRPGLFPDLEKLHGDRDPDKGEGLSALKDKKFDAVIDTSGYYPRHVKASAELLAPNIGQYVFISTVSVYKDNSTPNSDETAELATIDDPKVEDMGKQQQNYGPLKALCEKAAEKAMPGKATIIRPGFIVGPGDWSGRFNYWPLRVEKGGEVLAPGAKEDPVQVIDVRDLADWIVACIENNTTGIYNALGPKDKLPWGNVLDACKRVTKSDATFTWVPASFLEDHQKPGDYFPIWLDPHGETAGFHSVSNKRAVEKGLKFRPIDATIADLLAWYKELDAERQKKFVTGISPEREAELLKLWKEKKG